jgi:hypothetical protein
MRAMGVRGAALALQGLDPSFAGEQLMSQLPAAMVAKMLAEMSPHAAAQVLANMEQTLATVEALNLVPSGVAANLFTLIAEDELITTVGRAYKVDRKHRPKFEALMKESQEVEAAKRMLTVRATPMPDVLDAVARLHPAVCCHALAALPAARAAHVLQWLSTRDATAATAVVELVTGSAGRLTFRSGDCDLHASMRRSQALRLLVRSPTRIGAFALADVRATTVATTHTGCLVIGQRLSPVCVCCGVEKWRRHDYQSSTSTHESLAYHCCRYRTRTN